MTCEFVKLPISNDKINAKVNKSQACQVFINVPDLVVVAITDYDTFKHIFVIGTL